MEGIHEGRAGRQGQGMEDRATGFFWRAWFIHCRLLQCRLPAMLRRVRADGQQVNSDPAGIFLQVIFFDIRMV